jgi:hypothetical protein
MTHGSHPTTIDDITDLASFELFCDIAVAQETDAVVKRHAELNSAIEILRARSRLPTATAEDRDRLVTVESILRAFDARWHLGSAEAKTREIVRRKVRRDVKQALEWDAELSQLRNPHARENQLVEVRREARGYDVIKRMIRHTILLSLQYARFEHLPPAEVQIYLANKASKDVHGEDEPPDAVAHWQKALAAMGVLVLTLFPMFYLLLFGLQVSIATSYKVLNDRFLRPLNAFRTANSV